MSFRVASKFSRRTGLLWLIPRVAVGSVYRIIVEWILGIEIPWRLKLGPRARLYHGVGLVINDGATIGADVVLRHGVTIGHAVPAGRSPVIGDGVEFGAGAIVLGEISVGDGAIIGAGAVVTHDVPNAAVMVGNPARNLRSTRDGHE